MSAIPKKKLCWNCEGNIAREVDNCPYCGVYLHGTETNELSIWGPSYLPTESTDEIPPPPYPIDQESVSDSTIQASSPALKVSFQQLKRDVFPVLFLMTGSLFFLFGTVLFLFADPQGLLTLQWHREQWIYFIGLALPTLYFGWKYLHENDSTDS